VKKAATISIRALDANHDPIYGNGANSFLTDLDAVAQIIQTRLLLFEGEWWADLGDGLPLFQTILGTNNGKKTTVVSDAIRAVIEGTPFVDEVSAIYTNFNAASRQYTFACQVETAFSSLTVQFQPGSSAVIASDSSTTTGS
jgi:hypothetical protein